MNLRAKVAKVRLRGPDAVVARARAALGAWMEGAPADDQAKALHSGRVAAAIGEATLAARPAPEGLDCTEGCAFCCILSGDDGGVITGAEAQRLHLALTPLAGRPDGRGWHPMACPSLDPDTRRCRAYEARPVICRSYVSRDVTACEAIAEGRPAEGAGTRGAYGDYLTIHALARAVLPPGKAPTYALRRIAQGAVEGEALADSLKAARHKAGELDAERRRITA
ncbi:MAG: YkgJ family cysteine cluster protein [Shimia sp.]